MSYEYNWPRYFPPNCPCKDSIEANGSFYRLVVHDPPIMDDFLPQIIIDNKLDHDSSPKCKECGISVLSDMNAASDLRKIFKTFKDRKVALCKLTPNLGKIKNTPSNNSKYHVTWWLPDSVDPSSSSIVLDE